MGAQYGRFEAVVAHSFGVLASFVALREGERVQTRRLVTISGIAELDYLIDRFCALLRLRPRLNRELRARVERATCTGARPTSGSAYAPGIVPSTFASRSL